MAEEPTPSPSRISSQALDVLFKLEAEQIATLLPTRFGLPLAPILRPLPTEFPSSPSNSNGSIPSSSSPIPASSTLNSRLA